MNRPRLQALAVSVSLALSWATPAEAADATPPARSASASDGAASAVKHKRAKRKKAVVRKAHVARATLPVVKLSPAPRPAVRRRQPASRRAWSARAQRRAPVAPASR